MVDQQDVGERARRRHLARPALASSIGALLTGLALPLTAIAQTSPSPVPVEAAVAQRENVDLEVSGLGVVRAYNTVTIRTQVDGQLQAIHFVEGQEVKQGDTLAVVDPRPFQAVLDGARAQAEQDQASLQNAQVILDRLRRLAQDDFASREALDNQTAQVAQMKAKVDQDAAAVSSAEVQLSYTTIRSPIDGRTGIRLVDAGNIVRAADSSGIVVVTQMRPISVLSTLPEDDLARVRAALKAGPVRMVVSSRDGSSQLAIGSVALVNNQIDETNGTVQLKSTFTNVDEMLWPGQFVVARARVGVLAQAVTVPSGAVQRGASGFFVYVVRPDGTVAYNPVQLGQIANGIAVVEKGLDDGTRVVTAGQYRLAPGTRVATGNIPDGPPAGGK